MSATAAAVVASSIPGYTPKFVPTGKEAESRREAARKAIKVHLATTQFAGRAPVSFELHPKGWVSAKLPATETDTAHTVKAKKCRSGKWFVSVN